MFNVFYNNYTEWDRNFYFDKAKIRFQLKRIRKQVYIGHKVGKDSSFRAIADKGTLL